ncbi:MAG TPA: MmcQ/YjbR family DNA-binding protein [Bacteroidia bacterium]|jgi:predicted DNA-binding protein (MmcQ/YjbR family)
MDIEQLQSFCKSLPGVTENIKWGHDLCFSVGRKMFCVTGLEPPMQVSFKVRDDEFEELIHTENIISAPYVGRYKWVLVQKSSRLSKKEWEAYIRQSYELIKAQLPKKILKEEGLL